MERGSAVGKLRFVQVMEIKLQRREFHDDDSSQRCKPVCCLLVFSTVGLRLPIVPWRSGPGRWEAISPLRRRGERLLHSQPRATWRQRERRENALCFHPNRELNRTDQTKTTPIPSCNVKSSQLVPCLNRWARTQAPDRAVKLAAPLEGANPPR